MQKKNAGSGKLTLKILLMVALGYFADQYFMFYGLAAVILLVNALLRSSAISSIFSGILSAGALWFAYAFYLQQTNGELITEKIASIFGASPISLVLVSGGIGALLGALSAYAGYSLNRAFEKKKQTGGYHL